MNNACQAQPVLELLSKKWILHILRELEINQEIRFNEFCTHIPITAKVLNNRLEELLQQKIIERHTFNEVPPKVTYTLTEKGKELVKCFSYLEKWSDKYE